MSDANPTWGSPRIMGELRKLGIDVAKSTVEKYRVRRFKPPSPTWQTFLANHAKDLVSIDFFTVATVRFEILYVLVVLEHDRRRVRHFGVTMHPTADWTAQQIVEAFPWETAPRYLLHDREHYHRWRCHQGLAVDCPEPRPIQLPTEGEVVEVPEAGGMYRHYERRAA